MGPILGTTRNDVFSATASAEEYIGNGGIDKVSYLASTSGVRASLLDAVGTAGFALGDTYSGIRNLQGSAHDDYLAGNEFANLLQGGDGRDRLVGWGGNDVLNGGTGNDSFVGGAGADVMSGGSGERDAVDYSRAKSAIALNLDAGGTLGEADGDSFLDIEFVYASDFADVIEGNDQVNRIVANDGDDIVDAGAGNDYVLGGAGNDSMTGGLDKDVFIIEANGGEDIVNDLDAGAGRGDRVWLQVAGYDSFAEVMSHATDVDGGVHIDLGSGNGILLAGLTASQLAANDFIFD